MPIKIPIPSINTRPGKELWEKLRNGLSSDTFENWIKANMTGKQLIPEAYKIWFQEKPIKVSEADTETEEISALRTYLHQIYDKWGTNQSTWKAETSRKNERIKNLLSQNRNKRYELLALDYLENIKSEGSYILDEVVKLGKFNLWQSHFLAIAIYSSAQYWQMNAIAREKIGSEEAKGFATLQDLGFLIFVLFRRHKLTLFFRCTK